MNSRNLSNRILSATVICLCYSLSGCGGGDESVSEAAVEKSIPAPKANNPLAAQQQLLNQAKGVQAMMDTDTARKKKTLEQSKN